MYRLRNLAKAMDERISLESVKRTGFSALGEKPEEFAQSRAQFALSGSHRAHKGRLARRFFRYLHIVCKHYRLYGGEG